MSWRIYYGDGSTWNGDPFLAPRVDVQVVKFKNVNTPRGFGLIHGHSTYCWMGDFSAWDGDRVPMHFGWQGCDQPGMYDYLMHYRGPQAVLLGRVAHDEIYQGICRRAEAEPL